MTDQVWFIVIPAAQWEHIAYFFAGCIFSGIAMGLAGIMHNRYILKTLPTIVLSLSDAIERRTINEEK